MRRERPNGIRKAPWPVLRVVYQSSLLPRTPVLGCTRAGGRCFVAGRVPPGGCGAGRWSEVRLLQGKAGDVDADTGAGLGRLLRDRPLDGTIIVGFSQEWTDPCWTGLGSERGGGSYLVSTMRARYLYKVH